MPMTKLAINEALKSKLDKGPNGGGVLWLARFYLDCKSVDLNPTQRMFHTESNAGS